MLDKKKKHMSFLLNVFIFLVSESDDQIISYNSI